MFGVFSVISALGQGPQNFPPDWLLIAFMKLPKIDARFPFSGLSRMPHSGEFLVALVGDNVIL